MKGTYLKSLEWVLDYASNRIDRNIAFPSGSESGLMNVITCILRGIEHKQKEENNFVDGIKLKIIDLHIEHINERNLYIFRKEKDRLVSVANTIDCELNLFRAHLNFSNVVLGNYTKVIMCIQYARRGKTPVFIDASELDLRLLSSAANLYDAAAAARAGDFVKAMGYMTGAALLASGADLDGVLASAHEQVEEAKDEAEYYKGKAAPFISPKGAGNHQDKGLSAFIAQIAKELPNHSGARAWGVIMKRLGNNDETTKSHDDVQYMIKKAQKPNKDGDLVDCLQSFKMDTFGAFEEPESKGIIVSSFTRSFDKAKKIAKQQ